MIDGPPTDPLARRQAWMREAIDLLAKKGITDNVTAWAALAFDRGLSPVEFTNQLAPR